MLKDHLQIRKYFRDRYKFLLVDEFQDTDPLQAEIAFFLSEEEKGKAKQWKDVQVSPKRLFLVVIQSRVSTASAGRHRNVRRSEESDGRGPTSEHFSKLPVCALYCPCREQHLSGSDKAPEDGQYQPGYVPLHFGRKKGTIHRNTVQCSSTARKRKYCDGKCWRLPFMGVSLHRFLYSKAG